MNFKSLLLIDDDEDDRGFFLEAIDSLRSSIECRIAKNGQEGLNLLTDSGYIPDIIFLDLNMPLMNGRQFLKTIKQHQCLKEIPVVILSTSSDYQTISETLSMGASHFITKPDKFSLWEQKLTDYLSNASVGKY